MKKLTLAEQELHLWISGAEPNVVHVDVTLARHRRQLERLGMTPEHADDFGGARFQIPIACFRGFGHGRRKTNPALKARRAETLRQNARSLRATLIVVEKLAGEIVQPCSGGHPRHPLLDNTTTVDGTSTGVLSRSGAPKKPSRWKEESARHLWARNCAKDSRICRYCHPEVEINDLDVAAAKQHLANAQDIPATITTLLALEGRFRNKFTEEHLEELEKLVNKPGDKLRQAVRTRLEKRQRRMPNNDGKQTPYVKHAVDVAMHATATCCRGCIERWHGGALPNEFFLRSKRHDLSDDAIAYLEEVVLLYINSFILPAGQVRNFMTELPHRPDEAFYEPGEYQIDRSDDHWTVVKVRDGYQGPRTPFKKARNAKPRRRSRRPQPSAHGARNMSKGKKQTLAKARMSRIASVDDLLSARSGPNRLEPSEHHATTTHPGKLSPASMTDQFPGVVREGRR